MRGRKLKQYKNLYFYRPDCDRRLWNFTKSTHPKGRFAGFTAGGEFHPAPKFNCFFALYVCGFCLLTQTYETECISITL